jgi:DNA polymerase-3 subunit delta'
VLASESAHQLLPTIRSRCLGHTMRWPAEAESLEWLAGQGVPAADAPVLLRAAGGRPEEALAWSRAGRTAKAWSQIPKAVARGEVGALEDCSPAQAIDVLQKVCHDLVALRSQAAPRFFAPGDLPRPASHESLTAWWRDLAVAQKTAEHPFNAGLMLESLVGRARAALHSPG